MIIPSIDLMDGKAVQLVQGKKKVIERDDPLSIAKDWRKYGEIAVIDLDSALGKGDNMDLIKEICNVADCRVGGGIRDEKKGQELLQAGAKKIIVGTRAEPEFLQKFPRNRVVVAVDSSKGKIVDNGWTRARDERTEELISELQDYCSEFLYTDVDVEGTMEGIDMENIRRLRSITKNMLTVAGGISTEEEVKELADLDCNAQLGMSIYSGKLDLAALFVSLIDFSKGLVPTIAQDDSGRVLMLAYSNKDSLMKAFSSGLATYYSRSRDQIWTKGMTSGNTQELITARYDCDRDTILLRVKQKGDACHTGTYSCFGEKGFSLGDLYQAIGNRKGTGSFTDKLLKDDKLLKSKIREESGEVLDYTDRDNLVWEIADLTYFVMVLMAREGIRPEEITNELWRRRR